MGEFMIGVAKVPAIGAAQKEKARVVFAGQSLAQA
jgi:hypothetical protein